ncbi:hypothetical protein B0H19DRAFT_1085201 [Mycena capillaripes]|nr:hypothetical protein B0H19DRAFT_1085201 [Mycena capillaripes]
MNYPDAASNTTYLLGVGPYPAPTNQQLAVRQMQAALDSGMFDHQRRFEEEREEDSDEEDPLHARGHQLYLPPPPMFSQTSTPLPQVSRQPAAPLLTVNVPVYGATANKTVMTTIVLPYNILPLDFFSRIHAQMNVDPATAVLGWKESAERKKDPYHRLSSTEDLTDALNQLSALQNSTRRKKPVIMEVVNLPLQEVQPDGKTTKKAEKPSETAVGLPELEKVQAKLTCAEHPGKNRWCYVMGPKSAHPGKHVEVGIDVVSLLARKMRDGEADPECINPPNILRLDELAERGRPREERNTRGRAQPALPPIHVHVGSSSSSNSGDHALRDVDTNVAGKRSRAESSDDDSDDDDVLPIIDVLRELDNKYPDLNYLQYVDGLRAQGIVYAHSALDPEFNRSYYKKTVGMADGAIGAFMKKVGKMVKEAKKRNGKKRARVSSVDSGKEN